MPRLIDAEALKEQIMGLTGVFTDDGFFIAMDAVLYGVDFQKTIDPESLRPHGRWAFFDFASPTVECSICGALAGWNVAEEYHSDRTNYCPNCGAKMDEEET